MALTPRKEEVARVVQVIDSGSYDTPEAMARDLLKLASEILAERVTWVVGATLGEGPPFYFTGPFYDTRSRDAFARAHKNTGMRFVNVRVGPPNHTLLASYPTPLSPCVTCGHHQGTHSAKFGCCAFKGPTGTRKRDQCDCRAYEAPGKEYMKFIEAKLEERENEAGRQTDVR